MKLQFTVYYHDGSSGIVEFEKPPGSHPESQATADACLVEAEKTGRRVKSMARTYMVGGKPVDLTVAHRPIP